MKTISEDQQVSSKVQDMKKRVATSGPSGWEHQTVQLHTAGATPLDYPVYQGIVAQRLVPSGIVEESHGLSGARLHAPTVTCKRQIQLLVAHRTGHKTIRCLPPNCPVCRKAAYFLQWLYLSWGLYILHPTGHLKWWSPSNISTHVVDIFKCSNTQVFNRITWWLA
jgi:hypothetical protein